MAGSIPPGVTDKLDMFYFHFLLPWCEMAYWLNWLDQQTPDWEFNYPKQLYLVKDPNSPRSFRRTLLDMYNGAPNNPNLTNMHIKVPTVKSAMLIKLSMPHLAPEQYCWKEKSRCDAHPRRLMES